MKKLMLAMLMVVMIAVPCLAQEAVAPLRPFSIDNTYWDITNST